MKQTAVEWLEIEIRELEATRNERSLSLHLDLYNEYFKQAKEMEKEQKYSIDFIMWYSGMDKDKIENAHKRWINETFKSE